MESGLEFRYKLRLNGALLTLVLILVLVLVLDFHLRNNNNFRQSF